MGKGQSPFKLKAAFQPTGDQPEAIEQLVAGYEGEGKTQQILLGVTGSGKTFTMANVIQRLGKKTLILAHNKTLAAQLYSEFKEFFPDNAVEYFVSYYDYYQPEAYVVGTDTYIEKDSAVNDEIDKLRHRATQALLERNDVIVVASVSCIYGIGSPDEYGAQKISLFVGEEYQRDELLKELVAIQFTRNDIDFHRGTFRVRGDVIEIFPAHEDSQIVRLSFFDDELEAITFVDPLRGQVMAAGSKAVIYPRTHYVVGEERMKQALEAIKIELRERLTELKAQNKLVEHQRLEQRTSLDLEMLEELGYCSGIENYSRHMTGTKAGDPPPTLIDFFGDDFIMMIDESHMSVPQVGGMYRGDRARKMNLVEHGFRLPSALDNRPLNFEEFEKKMRHVLYVSATPGPYELGRCHGEFVEQIIRPTGLVDPVVEVRDARYQVDDFVKEIHATIAKGFRVLATTLTKRLAEELQSFYSSQGMRVRYLHSEVETLERLEILRDLRLGEFDVLIGINLLREGLDLPEVALVGIFDADKEGFLRSDRALIQTIGRAARNAEGRVILYAYKTTPSMERAMQETSRRRHKQEDYNRQHHITPKTIVKAVSGGVLETLRGPQGKRAEKLKKGKASFDGATLDKMIADLTSQMWKAGQELRYEEAAKLRDEIKQLNDMRLLL